MFCCKPKFYGRKQSRRCEIERRCGLSNDERCSISMHPMHHSGKRTHHTYRPAHKKGSSQGIITCSLLISISAASGPLCHWLSSYRTPAPTTLITSAERNFLATTDRRGLGYTEDKAEECPIMTVLKQVPCEYAVDGCTPPRKTALAMESLFQKKRAHRLCAVSGKQQGQLGMSTCQNVTIFHCGKSTSRTRAALRDSSEKSCMPAKAASRSSSSRWP